MPYEHRRGRKKTLIVICVFRRDERPDTHEKIGAACCSGLRVDDHIAVRCNAIRNPGPQLRREKVGRIKLNDRCRPVEREIVDMDWGRSAATQ